MSRIIRKPNVFNGPFDPITPIRIASTPEDEDLLRGLRKDAAGYEEWDPDTEKQTSEMAAISQRQTSGSMGIIAPHTRYIITSKDFDIFAEIQGAICKHLRLHRCPSIIILPRPSYEKLAWDALTTKPFDGIYQFMIDRMTSPFRIPVYQDRRIGLILPYDVILCMIS